MLTPMSHGTARGWRRAVSCWRTSVWRCLSSRSPPTTTRRWKTSFIRCRFAPTSCHTRESLPRLRGRYEMINIKLDKTGGLTEALALAGEAERQEFERMLGCMLCTSRGIAAALLWRRWRASLTSTARHGWRWTLSRRCGSAPACFIFKPASAADRSSPAGNAPLPRRRRPAGTRR